MTETRGLTDRLRAFNRRFDKPVRAAPTSKLEPVEVAQFLSKLEEELNELRLAIDNRDIKAIADGLGDTIYVIAGIALQFGIDIDVVLDLVHRSNMTKDPSAEGDPVKGSAYRPPALDSALQSMNPSRPRWTTPPNSA